MIFGNKHVVVVCSDQFANWMYIVCDLDWKRCIFREFHFVQQDNFWWTIEKKFCSARKFDRSFECDKVVWIFIKWCVLCRMPYASILRWTWSAAASIYIPSMHTFWTCRKLTQNKNHLQSNESYHRSLFQHIFGALNWNRDHESTTFSAVLYMFRWNGYFIYCLTISRALLVLHSGLYPGYIIMCVLSIATGGSTIVYSYTQQHFPDHSEWRMQK